MKGHETNWEVQKAKLRLRFPKLKDVDLDFDERNKLDMLNHIQGIVGMTTRELQVIIETL